VDLADSLSAALSSVAELLDLRTGWIWLLDEQTGEPYLAAEQNLPPGLVDNPGAMEGSCYCLDTFRLGDLNGVANVNVVTCSRLRWLMKGTEGLRYHASIPLYARDRKLGVLNVASPEWRRLSPEDMRLLQTVGGMLGVAIERARLYARSAEAGAAEERNRLAREIHDTLAQGLAGIALQLETAEALLEARAGPEQVAGPVRAALNATRASLEEARRSVQDLRAATLEGRSLVEALQVLAAHRPDEGQPTLNLNVIGTVPPLSSRIEVGLFRVAQEAAANALTHAGATQIGMTLTSSPDRIRLKVEDDGRGFDPTRRQEGRFGIVGMSERVRLMDGEFHLDTRPGGGTRIEVVVPLG
jgi:two-component system, NarL family, sensor kinase